MNDGDTEVLRREFMTKLAGTGAAAGLASGCLGNGEENSDSNSEPGSNTGQNNGNQGNGNTNTGNPEQGNNQPAQENTNYEKNETEAEKGIENNFNQYYDGWIEIENPDEQLNLGNVETDKYPSMEIFEDPEVDFDDPEIEAFYLTWGHTINHPDEELVQLRGIINYSTNPEDLEQIEYPTSTGEDNNPNVEAILDNIIEGYTDISPDFKENNPEEYAEALGL